MRKFGLFIVVLVLGFVFFGSLVIGPSGFAIYIKREPGLSHIVTKVGGVTNIERLILAFNQRYTLLLVGYNKRQGVRFFEDMPALP